MTTEKNFRADNFFCAKEQKRLIELLTKKENQSLLIEEAKELESLIEAELNGAQKRAEELIGDLQ